ncbi:MAG TPA: YidB family protein [Reyranella sp.]|nr:YidB family protein [Reyranella sp.]
MGLMDILNGMQNGPRGGAGRAGGGGMSPLTMALLGLLAYKAVKSFSGSSADPANPAAGDPAPGRSASGAPAPGAGGLGLDEILRGGLGGQGSGGLGGLGGVLGGLGGGGAGAGGWGGLLTSGLGDLLDQFHGAGKGDAARSWVGSGQNEPIAPHELSQVLTSEQIDFLTQRTGLSREELLAGLSEQLPSVVDGLTPAGRLPTSEEMNRAV